MPYYPLHYYIFRISESMDPEVKKVELNGSITQKGNYLWGGALTLAWQHLRDQIIREDIRLVDQDPVVQKIVHNFNNCPFNKDHLSIESYYARAGYGNETVRLINKEVKEKFPDKSTEPLKEDMKDCDIIGFAYFLKKLMFEFPFEKSSVMFNGNEVKGFKGKTKSQKEQVVVHQYKNRENFIISLQTKSEKDQIFIVKQEEKLLAEEVAEKVKELKHGECLTKDDEFMMPKIKVRHSRQVKELLGKQVQNEKFQEYFIAEIYEIIKLNIDETGVKVENEGAVKMLKKAIRPKEKKQVLVDRSFWLVMKEFKKEPYFVAFIA